MCENEYLGCPECGASGEHLEELADVTIRVIREVGKDGLGEGFFKRDEIEVKPGDVSYSLFHCLECNDKFDHPVPIMPEHCDCEECIGHIAAYQDLTFIIELDGVGPMDSASSLKLDLDTYNAPEELKQLLAYRMTRYVTFQGRERQREILKFITEGTPARIAHHFTVRPLSEPEKKELGLS